MDKHVFFLSVDDERFVRQIVAHHLDMARPIEEYGPGAFSGTWKGAPVLVFCGEASRCHVEGATGFYIGSCRALIPGLAAGQLVATPLDESSRGLLGYALKAAVKTGVRLIPVCLQSEISSPGASGFYLCAMDAGRRLALLAVKFDASGMELSPAELTAAMENAAVLALEALCSL